jgi:hypothetical protein
LAASPASSVRTEPSAEVEVEPKVFSTALAKPETCRR